MGQAELQALSGLFSHYGESYQAGETVVRENDPSFDLYVVLRGSVEFSVQDPETKARRVLRSARPGEIFGEIACFSGLPRSATVVTLEETALLRFQRDTAIELIKTSPQFAMRIIQTLGDRLRANTEMLAKVWGQ